jgi:hypothetical protein
MVSFRTLGLWVLPAIFSCGTQFLPETLVSDLRVLAIVAEPPEVAPGETTAMSVLYTDPSRRGPSTVLWVGCEPDPQDFGRSPCNDATILLKPTIITDYPEGLQLLGFGATSNYKSKSTLFTPLDAQSTVRQAGTVGQILALVIGEEVDPLATNERLKGYFERIEKKETQAVVGLTRVVVSEKPSEKRNRNPTIAQVLVNGVKSPIGARLQIQAGQTLDFSVSVPASSREPYDELQPSGAVTKQETVVGAWYSTHGRFTRERFDTSAEDLTTFFPPGTERSQEMIPDKRAGTVWLVLRDNRGGQASQTFPFFICDESAKTPVLTSVVRESDGSVVASGTNTSAILDVIVGATALPRSAYNQALDAFIGQSPALPQGEYAVSLRTKNCQTLVTSLTLKIP